MTINAGESDGFDCRSATRWDAAEGPHQDVTGPTIRPRAMCVF